MFILFDDRGKKYHEQEICLLYFLVTFYLFILFFSLSISHLSLLPAWCRMDFRCIAARREGDKPHGATGCSGPARGGHQAEGSYNK